MIHNMLFCFTLSYSILLDFSSRYFELILVYAMDVLQSINKKNHNKSLYKLKRTF